MFDRNNQGLFDVPARIDKQEAVEMKEDMLHAQLGAGGFLMSPDAAAANGFQNPYDGGQDTTVVSIIKE